MLVLLCVPGIFLDNSFYGWDWMNVWRMDGCNKSCVQVVHQLSISDVLKFHDNTRKNSGCSIIFTSIQVAQKQAILYAASQFVLKYG